MNSEIYQRPSETRREQFVISRSRFVSTIGRVETVEAARAFIASVQAEMPDANHHAYAYIIGHGASVIEGMSDAGEPSGSAGPPILALLRGSGLGDTIIVVSRFFGGTKLGVGGLVRAYSDAARLVLNGVKREHKIPRCVLTLEAPYALYERVIRLAEAHAGETLSQEFGEAVHLEIVFPNQNIDAFRMQLSELSAGRLCASMHPFDT